MQNLENVDLVLQHHVNHDIEWNNSEVFGFRNGLEHELLEPILNLGLMENRIYNFSKYHSHKRLPPIKNEFRVPRGGDRMIVDPL